ncbi:MAG: hypothetical protein QXT03_05620 [Desulfurococcaceae archaeon]
MLRTLLRRFKKEKIEELPEDRKRFIRVYKMYIEKLTAIFYPIHLEWYEYVFLFICGLGLGLGLGFLYGSILKSVIKKIVVKLIVVIP